MTTELGQQGPHQRYMFTQVADAVWSSDYLLDGWTADSHAHDFKALVICEHANLVLLDGQHRLPRLELLIASIFLGCCRRQLFLRIQLPALLSLDDNMKPSATDPLLHYLDTLQHEEATKDRCIGLDIKILLTT